jgi:alpha-galactosidase
MTEVFTPPEIGAYGIVLSVPEGPFRGSLAAEEPEPGLALVRILLEADQPAPPPVTTLSWAHPIVDTHAFWHPRVGRDRGLGVSWGGGYGSKATSNAPVGALYSFAGRNRLTFALSDALHPVTIRAGVREETAEIACSVAIFEETSGFGFGPPRPGGARSATVAPLARYEATLRLDTRDIPYHEALADVSRWWAGMPGYEPASVPETARLPMYSTWYSFHQALTPEGIEEQCRLAKTLGCDAVIVDDGWQTTSNERGYAYAGDWRPVPEKIPDMRAHVDRVHALGMKYLLWYAVPFVGVHSEAYARFKDMLLGEIPFLGAGILDPRFSEVREYLIGTYEQAMREWDLDGFKLDFVDSFGPPPSFGSPSGVPPAAPPEGAGDGRDIASVPDAVDRLLTDVIARLRAIKPDVMVEFRQSYIGPLMRKYGNMFRAGDCPNEAVDNRVRTLDIRLLAGETATHADMLMWHADEPAESAALQLLNVLFSVPQISVLLGRVPDGHVEMLRFWLGFWRVHRDALLDGELSPLHPEGLYPVVHASASRKRVVAVYQDTPAVLDGVLPPTVLLVNGTRGDRLVVEVSGDAGSRRLEVRDCRGRVVRTEDVTLSEGLHRIDVPPAGLATLSA